MTDKEKAHYYDEWHEYFEPLARIRREIMRGIEYAHEEFENTCEGNTRIIKDVDARTSFIISHLLNNDVEVSVEVDNLIRTMLIEIEEGDEERR